MIIDFCKAKERRDQKNTELVVLEENRLNDLFNVFITRHPLEVAFGFALIEFIGNDHEIYFNIEDILLNYFKGSKKTFYELWGNLYLDELMKIITKDMVFYEKNTLIDSIKTDVLHQIKRKRT